MNDSRHFFAARSASASCVSLAWSGRPYVRIRPFLPALAVFLFFALLPGNLRGQQFAWTRSGGGTGIDGISNLRIGTNGSVLVSGTYSDTASFGSIVLNGPGRLIPFLAEYDSDGNVLSAQSGAAFDKSTVTDAAGNVYLVGGFSGSLQLGTNLLISRGFEDVFVVKRDASGNVLWARSGGGADNDWAVSVACDNRGNVFVAGIIHADATFGTNTLINGYTTREGGGATGFILKYDDQGNLLWARTPVGEAWTEAIGLAVDDFGNAYIAGGLGGQASFGNLVLNSGGPEAPFVAKYAPDGAVLWAECGTSQFQALATCVAIDAHTNIFLGGWFEETLVLGGSAAVSSIGSIDAFVAKIAPGEPSQMPPDVLIQPESQTESSGDEIYLIAVATGSQPLSFQWRMDGTNLGGEVRSDIAFLAQVYHSGDYTLVVTNPFGAVTSHVATVIITNPPGVVRPPNDNFDHAFVISTEYYQTNVSDEFATSELDDPNRSDSGGTIWWKWIAPRTGLAGCLAESASGEGPYIGVFAGSSLAKLTREADKEREDGDSIYFYATQGTTYYICIAAWRGGPEGYVSLEFFGPDPIALELGREDLVGSQGVVIHVTGAYGGRATIESSEDLVSWSPVAEAYNPPTTVRDPQAAGHVQRFYRAIQH